MAIQNCLSDRGGKKNHQPDNVDGAMKLLKILQPNCREMQHFASKCLCVVHLGSRDAVSLWQLCSEKVEGMLGGERQPRFISTLVSLKKWDTDDPHDRDLDLVAIGKVSGSQPLAMVDKMGKQKLLYPRFNPS